MDKKTSKPRSRPKKDRTWEPLQKELAKVKMPKKEQK